MTRFERQVQSNDAIRDAVKRILENFRPPTNEPSVMVDAEQDPRQRISCFIPVELIVNSCQADASHSMPTAIIRDLSSTSVGLAHDQRIDCERLTARVMLNDGEQIELSLSLLWERKWEGHKGWFVSGGKILEVASTKDCEGQPCLAGASSDGLGG
ncbi:MAG: hypothetical protein HYV60_24950 [Planctomycetia bacterium]|nr:hypothetical protein [Planctomycetia bacterium]